MIVPPFDQFRARLIAQSDGDAMGRMASIRFSPVAPTVALVCPFERFDGNPCDQLITYYLRTDKHALGACHRHIAHALDILVAAGSAAAEAGDDDLLATAESAQPRRAPLGEDDALLARDLIAAGMCSEVDFGTTAIHEGYGLVAGAKIVLAEAAIQPESLRRFRRLADQLCIAMTPEAGGRLVLATPAPELAEEWICQNRALRELLRDLLDDDLDATGYRYRSIADALPEAADHEPRLYSPERTGAINVRLRLLATTLEPPRQRYCRAADRRIASFKVERMPGPGDYVNLPFARYRIVELRPATAHAPATAVAVIDRIHRPSDN